jgi:hypothetical protein
LERHTHAVVPDAQRRDELSSASFDNLMPQLADLAADDIAEQFPTIALEFPELKFLDRSEISRAGVDRYAGQKPFQLQTLNASGLLHDICAGKVVTAVFKNIN